MPVLSVRNKSRIKVLFDVKCAKLQQNLYPQIKLYPHSVMRVFSYPQSASTD